ncbi:MAG: hypothetical protein QOD86_1506 [Miltoncostaeaceae bacterium]|jgi:hypothetical protein|nr:hypothetical protein [Miltoncostaeaceae bacterium]
MRGRTTAARRDGRATVGERLLTAAAVACGVLLAAPTIAMALTAQEAVDALNARRAAQGIPAGVTALDLLSAGCALHNQYMALNGFVLTHAELPASPGYSLQGARIGTDFTASEVLARYGRWTTTSSPWDVSPGHMYLLMAPGMRQAGYFESYGFQCMRFRYDPDAFTSGAPEFYSVPGNGRADVPRSQVAQSATGVPQTAVGIPAGQPTGPNILLYSTGLGDALTATDASLIGPDGPVEVRVVDEASGGDLYAGGGVMIPVNPLEAGTYTARVVWRTTDGTLAVQQFFFTTEGAAAPPPTPTPDPVLVPAPPAGSGSPDKPRAQEPEPDEPDRPIDPRLMSHPQAPSTTPTLEIGQRAVRAAAVPTLQRLRVARVDGTPAAMLWLRRSARVTITVKTRGGKVVRRIVKRRLGAGVKSVTLGRLAGGRYALVVTVKDGPRGATATTRNFRLAGGPQT